MSAEQAKDDALQQLQMRQKRLFDDIDTLRSQGVGEYVDLPQLIVCGDQSSGKSSVLEAISRFQFPVDSTACTRFAIELVLRRAAVSRTTISIIPEKSRAEQEAKMLKEFGSSFTDIEQFSTLVKEAGNRMGVKPEGPREYTNDVLRVEVAGPDKPHLTLVDLPGIIQTANDPGAISFVHTLVERYMAKERSVILVIVSASNDWGTQKILEMVKKHDPARRRTLGIVTKPDRLDEGSNLQKEYLKIVKNEHTPLRLGWHVVLNRSFNERAATEVDRDQKETGFLSTGVWQQIERRNKGAAALRNRLSDILLAQICSSLPTLIQEIESSIEQCKQRLEKLGDSRSTPFEQRRYLAHISHEFEGLLVGASDGNYKHGFFTKIGDDEHSVELWRSKMLRAVIHKLNGHFVKDMTQKGHQLQVIPEPHDFAWPFGRAASAGTELPSRPWEGLGWGRRTITRAQLADDLDAQANHIRGNEPENFPNSNLFINLFRDQSSRWQEIAEKYIHSVWLATRRLLQLGLTRLAVREVELSIYQHLLEPWLQARLAKMMKRLKLLVKPYSKGTLNTLNPSFLTNVNANRALQDFKPIKDALGAGASTKPLTDQFTLATVEDAVRKAGGVPHRASLMIISTTEVFYETAMRTFIDNVALLAVEECLIAELPGVFNPRKVADMSDDDLARLAAESQEIVSERDEYTRRLNALQMGLATCKTYEGNHATIHDDSMASHMESMTTPGSALGSGQAALQAQSTASTVNPLPLFSTLTVGASNTNTATSSGATVSNSINQSGRASGLFDLSASAGANRSIFDSASPAGGTGGLFGTSTSTRNNRTFATPVSKAGKSGSLFSKDS